MKTAAVQQEPQVHPFLLEFLQRDQTDTTPSYPVKEQEWPGIIQHAARHGLTGLLYRWLRQHPMNRAISPDLLDELQGFAARLVASNLGLLNELRAILIACQNRGCACVPLRGLALAEQLYGDVAVRPVGDLDLLIHKADLPTIMTALQALGYRLIDRRRHFAQAFSYTLEGFKDRPFPHMVEPHWTIAYPPFVERLDMEPVWRRCVPGQLLGVETQFLSREDLLLNLCLHLMHHQDAAPMLWVYELDQLLRQEPASFNWDLLIQTARQAGVGRLVACALERPRAMFVTSLPDGLLDQLADKGADRMSLASTLIERATIGGKESLATFLSLKGLQAKWRYLWRLLFPAPEFMRIHYGLSRRWQLYLAYPRRAIQLGVDTLRVGLQALSGSSRRRPS